MDSLEGKVAIVTGASRGIGFGIASILVDRGVRVCVTGRDQTALSRSVRQLGESAAIAVQGNVDDPAHQDLAIQRTIKAFGRLDMLVNNAAVSPVYGPMLELGQGAVEEIMAVNVLAPLNWARKAHDVWLCRHGGSIVNIGSVAALRASPGIGFYGVSKSALTRLTKELAVELAPNVRVNIVHPGMVRTRMSESVCQGREAEVVKDYPLGRLGEPVDVAGAVAFLLSDEASWITGSSLVIDGGLVLGGIT